MPKIQNIGSETSLYHQRSFLSYYHDHHPIVNCFHGSTNLIAESLFGNLDFQYIAHPLSTKSIDENFINELPILLQVDLNQEQAGKAIQKAQQYYSLTKRVPREQKDPYIFDEGQSVILKEILPYWAGYCKQYRDSDATPEFPSK